MPLFQEVQSFRSKWAWAIVGLMALIASALFLLVLRDPTAKDRASGLVILGIAVFFSVFVVPLVFFALRMHTKVFPDRIEVVVAPIEHRVVHAADVRNAAVVAVSLSRQLAMTRGRESDKGLVASGDQGVQIELRNGNRLLIGTQQPQALLTAIREISHANAAAPPGP